MIKSHARQRTTPWIAAIGPSSTIRARKALCIALSLGGIPGEGILMAKLLQRIAQIERVAPMRIDGEIIFQDGAAANWRELYKALREDGRAEILIKTTQFNHAIARTAPESSSRRAQSPYISSTMARPIRALSCRVGEPTPAPGRQQH